MADQAADAIQSPQAQVVHDDPYDILGEETPHEPQPEPQAAKELSASAPSQPSAPVRGADGRYQKQPHPQHLVEQARELGYADDEIEEMSTGLLSRSIIRDMRRAREHDQQLVRERMLSESRVRPEVAPSPVDDGYDWENNPDGYAPPLAKMAKSIREKDAEIAEMRKRVEAMEARDRQRTQNEAELRIDRAFERLPANLKAFFGDGPFSLLPDGPHKSRRLAAHAAVIASSPRGQDGNPAINAFSPEYPKALLRHIEAAYGGLSVAAPPANGYEQQPAEPAAPRITEEQWNGAGLAQPTAREEQELPKGEKRAQRNLARKLGVPTQTANDDQELEGFLG